MKITWIGTGIMGKAMLNRLANHGHIIHAYNRTYEKMNDLNHPNILKFKSIKEAVKDTNIIMTMVGYPSDVLDIYLNDEYGIFNYVSSEQICIDFTTSSPNFAIQLANNTKGIKVLDAPVTGGDIGALNGTLSIMVGGDFEIYKKVESVLKILGNKINYFGSAGKGQHAKLFNQILVAVNTFATAEVLNYCKKNNVDIDAAYKVFDKTVGNNWQLKNNGIKMLSSDLKPGFYIKHFIKDLKLVKENENDYLYGLNEILKLYQDFANQNELVNELGTQSIYELLKNIGEK